MGLYGVKQMEGGGERRTLYIPKTIDEKIEEARQALGMSRSRFYLYAVTKLLQELSILTETVHNKKGGNKE